MVTLSKINKDELHSILELSKALKVSFVNFRRLIPQGNGKSSFSVEAEKLRHRLPLSRHKKSADTCVSADFFNSTTGKTRKI